MNIKKFNPPFYLKNPILQTFLNSAGIRKIGLQSLNQKSEEVVLNAGDGVRLQGYATPSKKAKGIVILFHGWEGSTNSAYIVASTKYFLDNDFSVFRLNLRDHGNTHHLNQGLFYATLLDEVFNSVVEITKINPELPHFLMGFSMGANFVVRIAAKASLSPINNLKVAFAVNPPMDPAKATEKIDSIEGIRKFFTNKWKKSLRKKQELFPQVYDFNDILKEEKCMAMTEILIKKYTHYKNAKEYFLGYTLKENIFKDIAIPTIILTSKDDPVIPVEDFQRIQENEFVKLSIQEHGGHCAYIKNIMLESWYLDVAKNMFTSVL